MLANRIPWDIKNVNATWIDGFISEIESWFNIWQNSVTHWWKKGEKQCNTKNYKNVSKIWYLFMILKIWQQE